MKKAWKIILIIVLIALLLGAVSIGVGLLTGADFQRIYLTLDERYQLGAYIDMYSNWLNQVIGEVEGVL